MTFSQRLLACLLPLLCAFALGFAGQARAENEIQVREARLEAGDGGWTLDARFAFDLNSSLEDAVNRGISLYFTTDFELTRSRWYWFDEKVVSSSQSVRLWFQPLTRQYRVSSNSGNSSNGLQLGFSSLREALALVRNVSGWRVIEKGVVKPGTQYQASVRMRLDNALMPKPFQIDAVNNRDWNLSSDWTRFLFSPATPPAASTGAATRMAGTMKLNVPLAPAAGASEADAIDAGTSAATGTFGPHLTATASSLPLAFAAALSTAGAERVK